MRVRTHVKLNLGLSVLGRRSDGFHDLETLFVPYYGLGDWLEIEESESFGISVEPCSWDPLKDLSARAYHLLKEDFDLPPVRLRLEKGAPVGAGLGGGSADAAFALRMLSEIFSLNLSDEELVRYAARLGSDCPFFVFDRPMLARGRGEVLTDWDLDLSGYEFSVIVPSGISVSTREAYAGIVPRGYGRGPLMPLTEALSLPVEQWREHLVNDFEKSVFALHPQLAALKQDLYDQGAVYAAMSGSGSALFGIFPVR